MRGRLYIPNAITGLRLAVTPFVLYSVLTRHDGAALALFACAAMTDGLDGMAARRLNAITQLGAYLDPISDKALLSGTYLALAVAARVPWWFVVVVFGRDLLILAGALAIMALTGERKFPPSRWGKLSTLLQSLCAGAILIADAFPVPLLEGFAGVLVWPVAAATLWSGLDYVWRGWRMLGVTPSASRH